MPEHKPPPITHSKKTKKKTEKETENSVLNLIFFLIFSPSKERERDWVKLLLYLHCSIQ
jgi:hypothetical protein